MTITASFRFSTEGLPRRARPGAIRELRERGIVPLEPLRGRAVSAEIAKLSLPGVGILSGTLCGLRQDASAGVGGDDLFLGINVAGDSVAAQRGHEIDLGSGDAVLVSDAGGPFAITRPTAVRFIGVRVPRTAIASLVGGACDQAMRVIPRGTGALSLLTGYARALTEHALESPTIGHVVAAHVHDLVALTAGATRDAAVVAADRGVRAARLQAIKSDIAAHLEDESLTLPALAARHGVTPRYVQKIFETEDLTYTQFVLGQRLERAYRMLRDPRRAGRSISAIAYDVGFGDLSYFNRAFRRRYDATPSDVRALGRA